jgi:hypothetical protein
MLDLLKTYSETLSSIFSKFGIDQSYGEIESKIDVEWTLCGNESVVWVEDEELYSNDIRRGEPVYYQNWMLVYVDNGCGESFYQIFNTDLKNDEIEDIY